MAAKARLIPQSLTEADKVSHKGKVPVTLRKMVRRLCPPGDLKNRKDPQSPTKGVGNGKNVTIHLQRHPENEEGESVVLAAKVWQAAGSEPKP